VANLHRQSNRLEKNRFSHQSQSCSHCCLSFNSVHGSLNLRRVREEPSSRSSLAGGGYCPVTRLGEHVGATAMACGLVVEHRTHHQITGEPMKFLTLADWTGIVETELFAQTYKNYGLATVRYPVLEVTATVEPFENGRGFTLRVSRAGSPRRIDLKAKAK
jgi:DNA polymerase III alpha subunit